MSNLRGAVANPARQSQTATARLPEVRVPN